jgi:hypothetical protein
MSDSIAQTAVFVLRSQRALAKSKRALRLLALLSLPDAMNGGGATHSLRDRLPFLAPPPLLR